MIQKRIYEYFLQDTSLKVLFVFDPMGMDQSAFEEMTWESGYRIVIFDGAWFNLKYNLANDWINDKVVIYLKQAEPSDSASRESFPLLGELCTGKVFRNDDYNAYMQSNHIPSNFTPFVSKYISELQSSKVDKLMVPVYEDGTFSVDIALRTFASSYLGSSTILNWNEIIFNLIVYDGYVANNEKSLKLMNRISRNTDLLSALDEKLYALSGQRIVRKKEEPFFKNCVLSIKYNQILRNIQINATDPYKDFHVGDDATLNRMERFLEQARSNEKLRLQFFDSFDFLGADIHEERIISLYGANAEYWYLPVKMCWEIINDNAANSLRTSPDQVLDRMDRILVSNSDNSDLTNITNFMTNAAQYYALTDKLQRKMVLNKPLDYIQGYVDDGYKVDSYYRFALENYYQVDNEKIPETVRKAKSSLDAEYAKYTHNLNHQWLQCVKASNLSIGEIPNVLHQADFYKEYIEKSPNKQAVIVCDAMRYEVALDLVQELYKTKHTPNIEYALAMLPTETIYCKPALLPHRSLTYTAGKMYVDGSLLDTTQSREDHLRKYKPKSRCVRFDTIEKNSMKENRDLFKNDLVYIFLDDLDSDGHENEIPRTVDTCRKTVNRISKIIYSIMSTYNVSDVIVTSDHGFLMNDIEFAEKDKQQMLEDGIEKKTRYYLSNSSAEMHLFDKFRWNSVSAIDSDVYVAVPAGTNRVAASGGGYGFAHGGASLQELIIPIVRCHYRRTGVESLPKVGVKVIECSGTIVSSVLQFVILQTEAVSNEHKSRKLSCAIFDGSNQVTRVAEFDLNSSDINPENRKTPVRLTLNQTPQSNLVELRIWDSSDPLNPLDTKNVTNKTLVERDEF